MGRQRHGKVGGWWGASRLAEDQHGVVSRNQLRGVGLSEARIDHAVATGRLHPVFRGAFGVGHHPIGPHGRLLAAVLACGEGTVVSHGSAAWLLGLWERRPQLIDVIAPVEAGRKLAGVRRRHPPPPSTRERWSEHGIPCTSPSRTIADIAGFVGEANLRRTIEQAAVHRMLDVAEIDMVLAGPRRRGSRRLRLVLEDWRRYSPRTRLRSPMEAKLLPLLSQRDIPAPQCNALLKVGRQSFEIDFLWRAQRLAVETDGDKYHDNPEAQARDRRRDRLLAAVGYRIWRLSWDDLERRPESTMAELARRLRKE
jgi:very-short-patch-repair endonuclease